MKKVWLYVDDRGQLNLSFYKNETDDKPFKKFVGRQCYPYIDKLFNGKMKNRKRINDIGDHTFIYNNYYIDVFDLESVLEKYGTKPILEDITAYESLQTAKKIKKLKVQRRNKRIKVRATAAGIALVLISGVAAGIVGNKKSNSNTFTITSEREIDDLLEENIIKEEEKEVIIDNKAEKNVVDTEEKEQKEVIKLNYEDNSDERKAFVTRSNYGETITKYAKRYGVDPIIMIGIATQERGVHSEKKDPGGATGLMQIQNNVWKGKELTAFNYETNKYETMIVDESRLSDVYYNIEVGCKIQQNNIKEMRGNRLAALQCYNMGADNMYKILKEYSRLTGRTIKEILEDTSDYGWLDCRNIIKVGDQKYVEHVLSWIGSEVNLNTYFQNGEEVTLVATPKL